MSEFDVFDRASREEISLELGKVLRIGNFRFCTILPVLYFKTFAMPFRKFQKRFLHELVWGIQYRPDLSYLASLLIPRLA